MRRRIILPARRRVDFIAPWRVGGGGASPLIPTYVAVGNNIAATSRNGIVWTPQTITGSMFDLIYAGGLFVAVGDNTGGNGCATSPTGVVWTNRTIPGSTTYRAIAYNGTDTFVAVESVNLNCATSPNGITWTQRTTSIAGSRGVAFGAGLFAAAKQGGAPLGMTSPTGVTWTSRTLPAGSYQDVIFAGGQFVALASDRCATSPDGITWTLRTFPGTPLAYRTISYGAGLYVVTGTGIAGNNCLSSPDGITWTPRTLTVSSWLGSTFGNDQFVLVGTSNDVATSPDGINWTFQSNVMPAASYTAVAFGLIAG